MLEILLTVHAVCIISGGKWEQFQTQVLSRLRASHEDLANLHLMPTCGTKYYKYSLRKRDWFSVYSEDLSFEQAKKIIKSMELALHLMRSEVPKTWGPQIEDRGSQITLSALGQLAPVEEKENWDPSGDRRSRLRTLVESQLAPMAGEEQEFEVRVGGATSVDVTKVGIDKAYGMDKLLDILGWDDEDMSQVVFYGDKLKEGGNDYPVKTMGVRCVEVSGWEDTNRLVRKEFFK